MRNPLPKKMECNDVCTLITYNSCWERSTLSFKGDYIKYRFSLVFLAGWFMLGMNSYSAIVRGMMIPCNTWLIYAFTRMKFYPLYRRNYGTLWHKSVYNESFWKMGLCFWGLILETPTTMEPSPSLFTHVQYPISFPLNPGWSIGRSTINFTYLLDINNQWNWKSQVSYPRSYPSWWHVPLKKKR